jgi:hypothetical protein
MPAGADGHVRLKDARERRSVPNLKETREHAFMGFLVLCFFFHVTGATTIPIQVPEF